MTETTAPDWGVLAAALAAEGESLRAAYNRRTECTEHPTSTSHRRVFLGMSGRLVCAECEAPAREVIDPVDFTDPAIIFRLAEAWRERKAAWRSYRVRSIGVGVAAHAAVNDAGHSYEAKAVDDPTSVAEALARALLARAETQEGTP